MDSTDDTDEITFRFGGLHDNRAGIPESMPVSGIHRAVLEEDIEKVRRCIESGESINGRENEYNFSPLHMAVIYNNLKMLEYLLTQEGIDVEARSDEGRTPLYLATSLGNFESVEMLINAGADVNASDDENDRPLHVSVYYPHICELLLQHGACIYANSKSGNTLVEAVYHDCLDLVHMLLYHNVDVNSPDFSNLHPFYMALSRNNVEAQEILLDYVDDFNTIGGNPERFGSTLNCALRTNSPFIEQMIERGADVNYGDDPGIADHDSAFACCLLHPVDLGTFRTAWERLCFNDTKKTIDLIRFLDFVDVVPTFLPVIIESDNFEPAVRFFSKAVNYRWFVDRYAEQGFDLDQLTALTCRLFQFGFRAASYDIHAIFYRYGYCELFRMFLYMDNNFVRGWWPPISLTRLAFDIDCDLKSLVGVVLNIGKDHLRPFLAYCVCPPLIDELFSIYFGDESMKAVLNSLPRVPSLTELARNAARKRIWQSFKVANACQFYTIIDRLPLPTPCKDILTFKKKLYNIGP